MKNKISKIFIASLAILTMLSSILSLLLFTDEAFTMGITKYSLVEIIKIDSMDVHPPLYYILLKIFLDITTFWTNNLFVKIIFSRLLSFMCSLLTFIYLQKILKFFYLDSKKNKILNFSLFILLTCIPFKYVPMFNVMQIRMYAMAAMFITIQLYYMISFLNINRRKYLLLFTLFGVMSAYTHYISGFISGLLILGFLIFGLKRKINYFLSGVVIFLSYIPWIPVALNQFGQITGKSWWLSSDEFIKNVFVTIILIMLFCYPFVIYLKNSDRVDYQNVTIKAMLFVMISLIIVVIATSLLGSPMFQGKYMYPILLIYAYLGVIISMKYNLKLYSIFIIIVILFGSLIDLKKQIVNYNIHAYRTIHSLCENKNRNVKIQIKGNLQSPEFQTKLIYYKYNKIHVDNYEKYINHFSNSNIKINKNNYYLNKKVYFYNRKER